MDTAVNPTFQSQILTQPKLKANADNPAGPTTRYVAIPTSVAPFDNIHCRMAVFYAWNKASGSSRSPVAPPLARSRTRPRPPGILGYDASYNPYPDGKDSTGDLTAAKKELAACGKPNGFTTKFTYATPDVTNGKGFAVGQGRSGPRRHHGHGRHGQRQPTTTPRSSARRTT